MEDDLTSSATMTSVTEDLSDEESDEVTGNDLETSSLITSSDANEEGNSTVIHTPLLHAHPQKLQAESDGGDMSTEGDSGKEEMSIATDEADTNSNALLSGEPSRLASASGKAEKHPPERKTGGTEGPSHSADHAGKGPPIPNFLSSPGNWYEHSCFNHYWRHYQFVSMWCQKHMEVYKTVIENHSKAMAEEAAAKDAKRKRNDQADANVFKKPTSSRTIRNRKARRRRKAAKRRMRMAFKNAELAGGCSPLSASSEELHVKEEEGEEEEPKGETTETATEEDAHMEISEEMLDFFAHTHRHRKERDALKKSKKSGKEEKHVNIEEVRGEQKERTVAAPTERPGAKRTSEMRHLYGKGAAMIHGMETALQMTFDRNLDVHQPSLWPNMPFRVIFD